MRLLAIVEYDGTDFAGFQLQAHRGEQPRTVQAELERAVAPLAGAGTRVIGSGRTDAGVHATGQAVHLDTEARLSGDLPRFLQAWNARLPADVTVRTARRVPPDFHARYAARSRTYAYRIVNGSPRSPLLRRYTHHVYRPLAVAAMNAGAQYLAGVHDFAPFAAQAGPGSTYREVFRATVVEHWANPPAIWHTWPQSVAQPLRRFHGPGVAKANPTPLDDTLRLVTIEVEANAFLRHMMRRIAGTLIEIGRGLRPPAEVASILASGEKVRAGQTAPARGLCLQHVRYDLDEGVAPPPWPRVGDEGGEESTRR